MSKFRKGFTLIELLVVIAIIGILSSVVLASLNTARGKGKDASTKSSVSSARAEAEIIYDNTGSYLTVCTTNSGSKKLLDAAVLANGGALTCNVTALTGANYAAGVTMTATGVPTGQYFCVDSSGAAGLRTTVLSTATVCPAS